jgi:hypothetical protein
MSFIIFTGLMLLAFMLATGISPIAISSRTLLNLAILYAALKLCDLYRQRFYLDWHSEWGFHWRAGLLPFAKWPYVLLALCDAVTARRTPYVLTAKVRTGPPGRMLLWPNIFVMGLIFAAWITGRQSGVNTDFFLDLSAAIVVTGSILLILTENMKFPEPYDKNLQKSALRYAGQVNAQQDATP